MRLKERKPPYTYQKCRKNDHLDRDYCIKKYNGYNKNKI